jgi:hypothetical protein
MSQIHVFVDAALSRLAEVDRSLPQVGIVCLFGCSVLEQAANSCVVLLVCVRLAGCDLGWMSNSVYPVYRLLLLLAVPMLPSC